MEELPDTLSWQAMSHPLLAERKPNELFLADFAERYSRLHHDLWERIIRLHGTIHTLERLGEFPFDHVYGPNGMEFWRLVAANFLDTACLMLNGLINDTGEDVLSIRSFKNEIVRAQWADQGLRNTFLQTLEEREFDNTLQSIAVRVKRIRDGRVAHRLTDKQTGRRKDTLGGVDLEEFRRLFDAAHALFGALSFGSAYGTLAGDLMPGAVGGQPTRTCLDEVLDAVLLHSYFVNEPERRRPWWSELRKHIAPEQLEVMNSMRRRIGLPDA